MSKTSIVERGFETGMQHGHPVMVAAAFRDLDHARSDAIEIIDLSQLIGEAVEANRHGAFERRVRIACCVIDDLGVLGNEREIATRLRNMLASAIDMAVPGTRMECEAIPGRSGVVVRVRFMRPAKRPEFGCAEIVGSEISACWPMIEDL